MEPAKRLAGWEDLLALPEDTRAEVLAGELIVSPAPLPRHSHLQRTLGRFIGGPFADDDGRGGPGGWWIFVEVDVTLGPHDIVRPDLSGWRRERLAEPWDVRPIAVRPDWICEVLSPSNSRLDRVTKTALYARFGVPHYWIVDPKERFLEGLTLRDGHWMLEGRWADTGTARIPPFDAIELDLGRLFPPE